MDTKAERGKTPAQGEVAGEDARSGAPAGFGRRRRSALRGRDALARIDAALARLDTGQFGFCGTCGDQIDLAALDEDPTRTECETCDDDRQ